MFPLYTGTFISIVHRIDRFDDNSRWRRRKETTNKSFILNAEQKLIWTRLFSGLLYQPPSTKKKEKERADNETLINKEHTFGDGLVLELTSSLGELRELGSL